MGVQVDQSIVESNRTALGGKELLEGALSAGCLEPLRRVKQLVVLLDAGNVVGCHGTDRFIANPKKNKQTRVRSK